MFFQRIQHMLLAISMMLLSLLVNAQCPNDLYQYNTLQQTASTDYGKSAFTFFVPSGTLILL
jgi:hypothetical protein